MSTLAFEPRAKKVSFDADNKWVELADGRQLGVPLAYFPRLLDATQAQRDGYIISGGVRIPLGTTARGHISQIPLAGHW
jgi:Protein of unknown function (DUF2442)